MPVRETVAIVIYRPLPISYFTDNHICYQNLPVSIFFIVFPYGNSCLYLISSSSGNGNQCNLSCRTHFLICSSTGNYIRLQNLSVLVLFIFFPNGYPYTFFISSSTGNGSRYLSAVHQIQLCTAVEDIGLFAADLAAMPFHVSTTCSAYTAFYLIRRSTAALSQLESVTSSQETGYWQEQRNNA